MTRPHKRWSTTDLATIRQFVADGLTAREIAPRVGVSRKSVIHIIAKHELGPWIAKPGTKRGDTRHIPGDFAERWSTTSQADLAALYGRGLSTISTWCKRLELVRPLGRNLRVAAPKPKPRLIHNRYQTAPVDRPHVDMTTAGRAAEYLRRFGPVVRCNEAGRYDPAGMFWRRGGGGLLSDAEIVERAEFNGWTADAWKRVA